MYIFIFHKTEENLWAYFSGLFEILKTSEGTFLIAILMGHQVSGDLLEEAIVSPQGQCNVAAWSLLGGGRTDMDL